jgi:hypothetical protein
MISKLKTIISFLQGKKTYKSKNVEKKYTSPSRTMERYK